MTKERPRACPVASAQDGRQVFATGEGIRDGSRTRRSGRRHDAGLTHDPPKAIGEDGRRDGVARSAEAAEDEVVSDVNSIRRRKNTSRSVRRRQKT